jgi:hypothetical protein
MVERAEREHAELHVGPGHGRGRSADRAVAARRDQGVDPMRLGRLGAMAIELSRIDRQDPGLDAMGGKQRLERFGLVLAERPTALVDDDANFQAPAPALTRSALAGGTVADPVTV